MMSANFSGGSYGILPLYIRHGGYFHQSFTEYLLSLFNWSELTSTCLLHPPSVGTTKQILKTLRQEQPCTLILMKATLFILIKLKMIDRHRHWRISTVFKICVNFDQSVEWKKSWCILPRTMGKFDRIRQFSHWYTTSCNLSCFLFYVLSK